MIIFNNTSAEIKTKSADVSLKNQNHDNFQTEDERILGSDLKEIKCSFTKVLTSMCFACLHVHGAMFHT